ncbi:hypothetical protein KY338_02150 [Candidatus Woesearchaeota archaeon]|nr:hypothetical protein [Candidatus Woesearchaeota archaeon]MBW3006093.1 hypothetical protein [Candidatus Woesearchaeota archaeon]
MATPLDIGLLQKFDVIFPFLLVLVLGYVVLTRISWFKENQGICFIISFALAVLAMFNTVVVKTINMMAPWFVLLFVFMLLVFMAYVAFGIKEETILETVTSGEYGKDFGYWILAIVLIIGLGSLSTVISEEKGFTPLTTGENATYSPEGAGTEEAGFWETLFHPKVLGLVLILLIALFTIQRLAAKS